MFDPIEISDNIRDLSRDPSDVPFLESFACTQIFSFLLENYIAALNHSKSTMGEEGISRQSDFVLGFFDQNADDERPLSSRAFSQAIGNSLSSVQNSRDEKEDPQAF